MQREFLQLKQNRRQLQAEREQAAFDTEAGAPPESTEAFKARLHLAELLIKLAAQSKLKKAASQEKAAPRPPSETDSSQKPKTSPIKVEKPVEPKVAREPAPLPGEPSSEQSGKPATAGEKNEKPASVNKAAETGGSPSPGKDKPVDPVALAEALFRTGDYEGALATYRLLDLHSLGRTNRVGAQYMMACCLRKLGKTDEAANLYREVANSKDDEILADCAQWQLGALRWRHDLETQLHQIQQRRQGVEVKP